MIDRPAPSTPPAVPLAPVDSRCGSRQGRPGFADVGIGRGTGNLQTQRLPAIFVRAQSDSAQGALLRV